MAQTTGATSAVNAVIEISTNGSSWVDASGHSNKLAVSGGERVTGDLTTFSGDTPIITRGKRNPLDIKIDAVYTETAGEVQRLVRAAHQTGTDLYVRWSVKAASSGNLRYTSAAGVAVSPVFPNVDAGDGKPVMTSFTVRTSDVTEGTIP